MTAPVDLRAFVGQGDVLKPYVPRLLIEWVHNSPEIPYRQVEGSLAFVDISGFTALTERLARRGKVGAEILRDTLDGVFNALLDEAYLWGAGLIKWGGDALLLLFDGPGHEARAARAAWEMQRTIERVGRLRVGGDTVTLRMSIGITTGPIDFFTAGSVHRELLVVGPIATETAEIEAVADAGEIGLSQALARHLDPSCVGPPKGGALLLVAPPDAEQRPAPDVGSVSGLDVASCIPIASRAHVMLERSEPEHRTITAAFIDLMETDALLARLGPIEFAGAIDERISSIQEAALRYEVPFNLTDISKGSVKTLLTAGAPSSTGHDEEQMLRALREVMDEPGVVPMRVGVNTGRVFTGDFGPRYRRAYSVFGDAVNTAARVMARAEAGQILSTEIVLERSRTTFATTPIEPFQVKGKAEPLEASIVGPIVGRRGERSAETPFVGRDAELAALASVVDEVRHGNGWIVEIGGAAGAGRSRLVQELVDRSPDLRVLHARCEEYEASTPYFALRAPMRAALGLEARADADAAERRLREVVARDRRGARSVGAAARHPARARPAADTRDEQPRRALPARHARRRRAPLPGRHAWRHRDDAGRRGRPVHGRGERRSARASLAGGRLAAVRPRRHTLRSGDHVGPGGRRRSALSRVHAAAAHRSAGGRDRRDRDRRAPAAAARRRGDRAPLRRQRAVSLRAARHGPHDRDDRRPAGFRRGGDRRGHRPARSARPDGAALCLGARGELRPRRCWSRRWQDEAELDDLLWQRLHGIVDPDATGRMRFRNTLVRDAAYEGLPFRRRSELHARVAEAIESAAASPDEEAPTLALHFFEAQRHDKAWHYGRVAGDRARAVAAPVEAARFYELALAAGRHVRGRRRPRPRGRARRARRRCARRAGLFDAVVRRVPARDTAAAGRPRRAGPRLRAARTRARVRTGPYTLALRETTAGLRLVEGRSRDAPRLRRERRCSRMRSEIRMLQGRAREAISLALDGRRRSRARAEELEALARAYTALDGSYQLLGEPEKAVHERMSLEIYTRARRHPGARDHRDEPRRPGVRRRPVGEAADLYLRAQEDCLRAGDRQHTP